MKYPTGYKKKRKIFSNLYSSSTDCVLYGNESGAVTEREIKYTNRLYYDYIKQINRVIMT